jgi:hypothetical protein
MQTWICAFCHREFYDSQELINHIYNVHQEDMAEPDIRAKIYMQALHFVFPEIRQFPRLPIDLS